MATVWATGTRVLQDVSVASWLEPRLSGGFGAVTRTAPDGFEAYARVLHPVREHDGERVTWAHVGAATGRTVHPLVQWHALVDSTDTWNHDDSRWPHGQPRQGSLDPAPLGALRSLLAEHTTTPEDCVAGIWEGWGWTAGAQWLSVTGSRDEVPSPFTADELAAPLLRVPHRAYRLVGGPLTAVAAISAHGEGEHDWQSPSLLWPADRAWFVATEVDFDSTLVAGPVALVAAVLAHPELEAWPVEPRDSLASDGDTLNPTNPRALPPSRPPRGPLRRLRDRLGARPGPDPRG